MELLTSTAACASQYLGLLGHWLMIGLCSAKHQAPSTNTKHTRPRTTGGIGKKRQTDRHTLTIAAI